jgi:hypothetical protein
MSYTVLFHPGSYGTYLSWAVYTYSELNVSERLESPIGNFGSAHLFRDDSGYDVIRPMHYTQDFVRAKNVILVTPDFERLLEYLDNQIQKNYNNNIDELAIVTFPPEYKKVIEDQWNTKKIDFWQKREYISFFIGDFFKTNKEYYTLLFSSEHSNLIQPVNSNTITISSNEILFDLKNLIHKIFNFYNLKPIKTIDELETIHQEYLNKQNNINKYQITSEIVSSIIENNKYKIENLTIIDEAWIQHRLRQQGYEIKCYQLNKFPDCTSDLHKLLEKI